MLEPVPTQTLTTNPQPSQALWGHQVGNYPALSIVPDMELVLNKHFSWMKEKKWVNESISELKIVYLKAGIVVVGTSVKYDAEKYLLSHLKVWIHRYFHQEQVWHEEHHDSEEMSGGSWVPGRILLGLGGCSLWPSGLYSFSDDSGRWGMSRQNGGKAVSELGEFQDTWDKNRHREKRELSTPLPGWCSSHCYLDVS